MQPEQNYWQDEAVDNATTAPETPVEGVSDQPLTWQASEFVHQEKNGIWFLGLFAAAVVLLVIDFFLIKSWTFGALIVVMGIAAGVVANRPPRMLNYTLSAQGMSVDEKHFSFHDFRAFGVIQEGAFYSIRLIPNKRFMPMVSVFFPPEMGEEIVDMFGSHLPMQELKLDTIDRLVEKLRF